MIRLTELRETLATTVSQEVRSQFKSHASHHIFITAFSQNVHLQHERKDIDVDATRQQHVQ